MIIFLKIKKKTLVAKNHGISKFVVWSKYFTNLRADEELKMGSNVLSCER